MKTTRILSIVMALCLLITAFAVFTACGDNLPPSDTTVDTTSDTNQDDTQADTTATTEKTKVNMMVLNGTTGFGMAPLMDKNAKGEASLDYTFSVESDASNITAALINGSVDMAALPTNAAAALRW